MTIKRFLPIAVYTAFLGAVIQVVDQLLHTLVPPSDNLGFSWLAFQAWAVYFMAGCTVKNGARAFFGYLAGMLISIGIMEGSGLLANLVFFATPLAILVLVPFVLCLELGPDLVTFIPAVFVGAGAFFGCMTYVPGATYGTILLTESVYCILGLTFGWLTIAFRTRYEASGAEARLVESVA